MIDREGCILLNMISGIGHAKYRKLMDEFGSESEIFRQSFDRLKDVPGIGDVLAERLTDSGNSDMLKKELERSERGGARIITLNDSDYPPVLRELHDPPLCIYLRGTLPDFSSRTISVVGSRRMSRYGERMTREIVYEGASQGYVIVSGLAAGVDTTAHQAAVDAQGITVAVLGGGLMKIYPESAIPLARRIIECGGAVISEFPLGFPVSRTSFPRRNRIVAALGRGTLVTEAGLESGAMITAGYAMDYGREVMALPGMADNPQAAGCHKLIKEGAYLVENFTDVQNILEGGLFMPSELKSREVCEEAGLLASDIPSGLNGDAEKVYRLLLEGEKTIDAVSAALQDELDTGKITSALMKLQLMDLAVETPGGAYCLHK